MDFVRTDNQVVLLGKRQLGLQLFPAINRTARILGITQHQQLFVLHFPFGRAQVHDPAPVL